MITQKNKDIGDTFTMSVQYEYAHQNLPWARIKLHWENQILNTKSCEWTNETRMNIAKQASQEWEKSEGTHCQ